MTLPLETRDKILSLKNKKGLTFREIGEIMSMDFSNVRKVYTKEMSRRQKLTVPKIKKVPAASKVVPVVEAVPGEAKNVTPVARQNPDSITIDISLPTVPKGVLLTDEQLADKMGHLIQRLLALTEGEADIIIADMTGPQRIEAAAKMIDKIRLLKNKTADAIDVNTFVSLITKLTAEIGKKRLGRD